jgi:aminoglycoside phosphotransferase (APT) family kinase protein
MTTSQLPNQPGDLTAEWLSSALQGAGIDADVAAFTIEPVGEGVGMMGVLCAIELEYSRGSGPSRLIGKFPTPVEANLGVALHFDIYRREVRFYRDVAPLSSIAVPAVHVAEMGEPSEFVILMEDLSDHRRGDQVLGCTPAEAAACMDELVRLHAPLWDAVDDPRFEFAFLHSPSRHSEGMRQAAIDGWAPMVAAFGDVVPAFMNEARERFLAAVAAMQTWMATPPITFVHGDFRMDNLLFGDGPGQRPVVVLDWQGVLRSKGIQDVAYLISQSMTVKDRRAHERDLVARWQRGLAAAGVTDYTGEQAWEDYRAAVLYLWVYVTVIAGALDPSNERGRQFMSNMITRAGAAIDDLGCLELLARFEAT